MLRKSTMLRFLSLALLAALASFGAFTVTAQPVQALWCAPTLGTCSFSHEGDFGNMVCCVYQCPNGTQRIGVCEQI